MDVNLVFSANAEAAPANIQAAWQEAANILDATFTDNITVNIDVTYGGVNDSTGGASSGPVSGQFESYSSVYNYLTGTATPGDTTFAGLPSGSSISGATQVAVWNAQLKLMGLLSTSGTEEDAEADFGTGVPPDSMVAVALHEFCHALGRVPYSSNGTTDPDLATAAANNPNLFPAAASGSGTGGNPDIFDFFDYTAPASRVINGNVPAAVNGYFSIDGGTQAAEWAVYGSQSDPSDFLNSYAYDGDPASDLSEEDTFDQFYDSATNQFLTPLEIEQMIATGFHVNPGIDYTQQNSSDFNGDNSNDILLQSAAGVIVYANMAGGAFAGFAEVGNTPGYAVVGSGKISGGADADVVLQNASGTILYCDMVNGALAQFVNVATTPGFSVVGVGDVNSTGYDDIVVQDAGTGEVDYANMNGGVFNNWETVAVTPGYTVQGVGDILGNGYADIVFESSSGSLAVANMTGGVFDGWLSLPGTPGWNVVGVGDVGRTGYDDVVIQDHSTGEIAYADMNNGIFNNWVDVAATPGWNVIGVEDVVGNGFDDIVVQDPTTGQVDYANMTAGTFDGWVGVAGTPGYAGYAAPETAESGVAAATASAVAPAAGSSSSAAASMFDPGPVAAATGVLNAAPTPAPSILHSGTTT
jgi:hypothetical protein